MRSSIVAWWCFFLAERSLLTTASGSLDGDGVRLAVHGGPCEFRHNTEDIVSDTINRTLEIEAVHTGPNTVTVSNVVYLALDPLLQEMLAPMETGDRSILHAYELRWEE